MASFTITKRKNKATTSWQYDVKHPSFKSGKKRKSGFKTKVEAINAAQQLIRDLDDNNNVVDNKKFKDYYNEWLIANGKDKLSLKQQYWYDHSLELFLNHFGENIMIKNITRSDYQIFLTNFANGRTSETVRKVNLFLSNCLKDAVYDGYLKKDPTYKVKAKGTKSAKKEEVKYITIKQYENLREYFKSKHEKSYIFLFILLITGGRFSEVNKMTYKDLMYDKALIHLPGTKTVTSDRFVEISKKDLLYIKSALRHHPKRSDGIIFGLSHNAVSKIFKRAKSKFNIEDGVTPYALRHTHASYLLSKGITIEYISKRLGHSNIAITLDIYTHLLDEHKREQGQRVRELFS
ncbi:tyrosine-type recombinase/integrase [Staphylococcus aureus]|uniref:tyrosine-type recombinase/integrase n=1 Tax=Staphylococcus aureus TaxID=1280 RepID=UPI001C1654D1|nr:site-specific integrase [Staphylococcus aureus]MBX8336717.1 site-specific integrase [Staphylococcus aureus]HBE7716753.1 site-specific integrase [Staphylococcus aureus]HCD1989801.1 site-specific integrase [Staphylococcus aureus]HCX9225237.1 site-specific integrase [Staphylococcus aureus]